MPKLHIPVIVVLAFALVGTAALAQDVSERFYQSIRNDDLAMLRVLVKDHGTDARDRRGQTPLMFAAAFGSLDAMKLLISNGADAKAESEFGVTALQWCAGDLNKVRLLLDQGAEVNRPLRAGWTPLLVAAATYNTLETVKLLLQKGADVNATDSAGFTPAIVAAIADNTAVVKLLIEKAANINAKASTGAAATALMGAARHGNVELMRLLLARKADVNAISSDRNANVKNGPVAFGNVMALHLAVLSGNAEVVKMLLDAGAPVNARDVRGLTPLTFAVATDRPNADIVRILLAKGADPSIRSNTGESTIDWARKFNHPAVLAELKLEAVKIGVPASERVVADVKTGTPQEAVERSLPLLQRAAASVFTDGGCVACHAQPVAGMAAQLAQSRGWRVDESVRKSLAAESERVARSLSAGMQINADNATSPR